MKKFDLLSPIEFNCHEKISRRYEDWKGKITQIINHGSQYEIHLSSCSGFIFIVGKYVNGCFISIPAF